MCTWKRACQVAPLQKVILRTQAARERETKYSRAQQRASSRAAAASAAKDKAMWYYLDHSRRQRGPVSTTTLISLVSKGALKKRTYVWRKGFTKWRPLNEIRELSPNTTTSSSNHVNQQDERERKRKLEEAAAARAAARALERARVEDERKRRQKELEEERRKRVEAQKRAEIERRKRLAKQREEEEERRRERIRRERIAQVASSRATSVAVSAATSALAAATSARAAATAATLTSVSSLETKKEQQRQAWTAESKTTKEEKWFYVDSKGSQRGPMSKSILTSLIDTNTISPSTYVWKVSMKTWKRLRDVPSLLIHRKNEKEPQQQQQQQQQHETKSSKVSEPLSTLDWNGNRNNQKQRRIGESFTTATKNEKKQWFYLNPSNRKREGPVSQRMLLKMLSNANITNRTYVWKAPMTSWKRIESVLNISSSTKKTTTRSKYVTPDTSKWFCLIDKKQIGPLTTSKLIEMNLENNTLVWQKGMKDWTHLRNVTSLFALYKDHRAANRIGSSGKSAETNVDRLAAIFDQAVKHMTQSDRTRLRRHV